MGEARKMLLEEDARKLREEEEKTYGGQGEAARTLREAVDGTMVKRDKPRKKQDSVTGRRG